ENPTDFTRNGIIANTLYNIPKMTKIREIIGTVVVFLVGCLIVFVFTENKNHKESFNKNFIENKTSFFDLNNSDWTKNTWIRKPENLKMVHESFKKFGYEKLEN